jgi:hypothetical protein
MSNEWAERGIPDADVQRWRGIGVTDSAVADWWVVVAEEVRAPHAIEYARQWHAVGVENPGWAQSWMDQGFGPSEAQPWIRAGVLAAHDAEMFQRGDWQPEEIAEWVRVMVPVLREAGIEVPSSSVIRSWSLMRFDATDAEPWLEAFAELARHEAERQTDLQWQPAHWANARAQQAMWSGAPAAAEWCRAQGMSVAEAKQWGESNPERWMNLDVPVEVAQWMHHASVTAWVDNDESVPTWAAAAGVDHPRAWRAAGVQTADVVSWVSVAAMVRTMTGDNDQFAPAIAVRCRSAGYGAREAWEWASAGFDPSPIVGRHAEPEIEAFNAAGLREWPRDVPAISATAWRSRGFSIQESVSMSGCGVGPQEAAQWRALLRSERQTLLRSEPLDSDARWWSSTAAELVRYGFTPPSAHEWTAGFAGPATDGQATVWSRRDLLDAASAMRRGAFPPSQALAWWGVATSAGIRAEVHVRLDQLAHECMGHGFGPSSGAVRWLQGEGRERVQSLLESPTPAPQAEPASPSDLWGDGASFGSAERSPAGSVAALLEALPPLHNGDDVEPQGPDLTNEFDL